MARSERAIQDELDRIAQTRTTLVIAHRMSTIINADEILVMEQGRIVERGRHDALLVSGGLYAQLWSLQQQERELQKAETRLAQHPVNLASLVAEVIESLQPDIEAKAVHLYTIVASRTALRVTGDPHALRQLVWDLCSAAIAASRPRERIQLDLERQGRQARLRVGIAARLGQPGAAAAIAEQHGGSLQHEGSSIVVDLPLRALGTPDHSHDATALKGADLMIVDDQEEARELLGEALAAHGAHAHLLSSAHEALEWFATHPQDRWPDLLLCDVALADLSGHELMREIRLLEAARGATAALRMPAIALTGFATPQDRSAALMSGFQMHLAKPVAGDELVAAVASLVGSRRQRGAQKIKEHNE
jgi:ATP-binding cassette, subfamily B, bacterial